MEMNRELSEIIGMFAFPGTFVEAIPYGNGHINDTYRLTFEQNGRPVYYILQRMNHKVFQKPEELMENIEGGTAWLKKKIQENGGDIYIFYIFALGAEHIRHPTTADYPEFDCIFHNTHPVFHYFLKIL